MNLAVAVPRTFTVRASDRLESAGILTRVLFLIIAMLTGAVLYLVANWPGAQPPVVVTIIPMSPVAAAPPPASVPVAIADPSPPAAGALLAEAVRAVSAASRSSDEARATAPLASESSNPAAPSLAREVPAAAAPATSRPADGSSLSASLTAGSTAVAADREGTAGAVRTPASPPFGPNRIVVPGSSQPLPQQPAAAPSAAPAASGANRIVVPTIPPSR